MTPAETVVAEINALRDRQPSEQAARIADIMVALTEAAPIYPIWTAMHVRDLVNWWLLTFANMYKVVDDEGTQQYSRTTSIPEMFEYLTRQSPDFLQSLYTLTQQPLTDDRYKSMQAVWDSSASGSYSAMSARGSGSSDSNEYLTRAEATKQKKYQRAEVFLKTLVRSD
jgi:hypothetical protein